MQANQQAIRQAIQQFISQRRNTILLQTGKRIFLQTGSALFLMALLTTFGMLILPGWPRFWQLFFLAPAIGITGYGVIAFFSFFLKVKSDAQMAGHLEHQCPQIGFRLRTSLEFQSQLAGDGPDTSFKEAYVDSISQELHSFPEPKVTFKPWGRVFVALFLFLFLVWALKGGYLLDVIKGRHIFQSPHLLAMNGTISLYEPDYTNIPGRTLPISDQVFKAYPGCRVQLLLEELPDSDDFEAILSHGDEAKTIPLQDDNQNRFEFILLQDSTLYLQSKKDQSWHSQNIQFKTLQDQVPELEIISHTKEGEINPRNPIFIEANVQDDFAVQSLQCVVQWDMPTAAGDSDSANENRLTLQIPPSQAKHFLMRNQWNVSDLVPEGTEAFELYLEAKDNNIITGPGVGISNTLHFGITTPEKLRREFMAMVRELLNTMTQALGDNLVTQWTSAEDRHSLDQARNLNDSIRSELITSTQLVETLKRNIGSSDMDTGLDTEFFKQFQIRLKSVLNARMDISQVFAQLHFTNRLSTSSFGSIKGRHKWEETQLEDMVYDLLLQLKLWAIMEMEQNQKEVEDTLSKLEELLNQESQENTDELQKQVNQLMDQLMKQMADMFQKAAQEMDMNIQEFMNMEAMKENNQEMQDLKSQLEQALKDGDMDKAKDILDALKQTMDAMMKSMKQSIGEMSPEMIEMMKAMQELTGLIQELKEKEEALEGDTQKLKRTIDDQIAELMPKPDEAEMQKLKDIIKHIIALMDDLETDLTARDLKAWADPILKQIGELSLDIESGKQPQNGGNPPLRQVTRLKRDLRFLTENGLDKLISLVLNSREGTIELSEYLDHMEFFEALKQSNRVMGDLFRGEILSQSELPQVINQEAEAESRFHEASKELKKIIDFLENLQKTRDQLRKQFLQQQSNQRPQSLSKRQKGIEDMIPDFLKQYEETLKRFPVVNQLRSIQQDMGQAGERLSQNALNPSLRFEQEALRKLGELLEQMQQMQQGQGQPNTIMPWVPSQSQLSQYGDPTGEVFIPEAERKARQSRLKDQVLKNMKRSLPQSHSKEIKSYYERLIDQ